MRIKSIFLVCIVTLTMFGVNLVVSLLSESASLQHTPSVQAQNSRTLSDDLVGWENLGLNGAHVSNIAFAPTPGIVYLATNGGYYESVDSGLSWSEMVDIGGPAVAVAQGNGHIYIAREGMSISADAGATWTSHPEVTGQIRSIVTDPNNEQVVFASTGNDGEIVYDGKIHRTLDGGETWHTTTINVDECIRSVAINPQNSNHIWAVGGQCGKPTTHATVYSSTNQGVSFVPVFSSTNPLQYKKVAINSDGIIFIIGYGVWVSHDEGENFEYPLTSEANYIAFDATSGRVHVEEHHSDDNGKTWAADTLPSLFGIDPHNPNIMFGPSGQGIQRSADKGIQWQEANIGIQEVLVTEIATDPTNNDKLFAVTQNGFARSLDNGRSWEFPILMGDEARNAWAVAVNPITTSVIYVGEVGGATVWRSENTGASWTQHILTPTDGGIWQLAIDPNDVNSVYAAMASMHIESASDGLYATHDNGQTWEIAGLVGQQVNAIEAVSDITGTVLYAGVGDQWDGSTAGGIFRKRVGETDWIQKGPTEAVVQDIAIDPENPNQVFIAVGPMFQHDKPPFGVFLSTNAGNSWTQVLTTTTTVFALAIDPQQPDVIYASSGQIIYRSTDNGNSWEQYYEGKEAANFQALYIPKLGLANATHPYSDNKDDKSTELQYEAQVTQSTLYLGTNTGLYRRPVGSSQVYLPIIIR